MSPTPSANSVQEIIAEIDPELRNLKITQCYHDLSQMIAPLLGPENVNWCTFATWASKSAGRFIRKDTFDRKLLAFFKEPLPEGANVIERVSNQVAAGNLEVFRELGPMFVDLASTFYDVESFDAPRLDRFLSRFAAGETGEGGQDLLRYAVASFGEARFETEPRHKAERMLLANARTGWHEQIRLHPHISDAMNAPTDMLAKSRSGETARRWREFATANFMQLYMPDGPLELGGDLRLVPGRPLFPSELQEINNSDLRALLSRFRALQNDVQDDRSIDWADLDERMRFILRLFRSRQRDSQLFKEPFSQEQRREIVAGRIPKDRDQL
jgi:hypothetical protein